MDRNLWASVLQTSEDLEGACAWPGERGKGTAPDGRLTRVYDSQAEVGQHQDHVQVLKLLLQDDPVGLQAGQLHLQPLLLVLKEHQSVQAASSKTFQWNE